MAELANGLLNGALAFAEARLGTFVDNACGSRDDLADAFGVPHAAASAPAVATHLATARSMRNAAAAAIAAGNANLAAARLADCFLAIESALNAVVWPAANPGLAGVLDRLRAGTATAAGLVQQLGLPALPSGADGLKIQNGAIVYEVASTTPARMSGPPGTALVLGPRRLTGRLRLTDPGAPALGIALTVSDARLSVGGDLVGVLTGAGGGVSTDLTLGADTTRGLTVGGTPHARVTLPAKPSAGLLDVRGLTLEVPRNDQGTSNLDAFDLGATISVSKGPMTLVIDGVGVRTNLNPAQLLAGTQSLTLTPLPPSGLGLSIDTGFVTGGGFLSRRGNQFGGTFDLRLGTIGVHAAGLLTVGGETGFALIVVMSIEFFPAIEIALGFTLNAVGGMIGLQHIIDTDALAANLRNQAVDHLLFPKDASSAANAIIQTLATTFPVRRGGFVVGPTLKLGWGRPTSFVTASLGIILSLPDPKVVILGKFRITVPAPELAIVDLKADVLGEFSAERVLLLAALVDSRIGMFAVAGDFGLLVRFGAKPELAFSAGGFHPRFTPPAELAQLRRLSIDFSPPVQMRLRAEAYFALTTNSLQAGARLELSAEVGPIRAHGHLEFDALIHLQTFRFEVDVNAGVTIRYERFTIAGVDLHLRLEGPAPWRARGTATFEVLGFPKDFEVGPITWGPDAPPPPPIAHPRDEVVTAISNAAAWQAQLPAGAERLVHLREVASARLLVHPLSLFEVRQRVVPLETVITHMGRSAVPADENYVYFGLPLINGAPVSQIAPVEDLFAPGQFTDVPEAVRLGLPAFEPMLAGVRLQPSTSGAFDFDRAHQSDLYYETFVADPDGTEGQVEVELPHWLTTAVAQTLGAGAVMRSPLRASSRYTSEARPIAFADPSKVLARTVSTLAVEASITPRPLTYSHAATALGDAAVVTPRASVEIQLVRLGVGS